MTTPQLIIALDSPDPAPLIVKLAPLPVLFKVHWMSFPVLGIEGLAALGQQTNGALMLDFKLHDIPNTVAGAVRSLVSRIPCRLLTLHGLGGPAMMAAARAALDEIAPALDFPAPRLLAITLLTSHHDDDLAHMGLRWRSREEGVLHLARQSREAGADGVVCTYGEAAELRKELGADLVLVCPGLRLAGSATDDHALTGTPAKARALGVDYAVVGRPVYTAPDPAAAVANLLTEFASSGS